MFVDPREHVMRESDCALLLAGHQRPFGRPSQDLEPLERQLAVCGSHEIPDLQRTLVVQPRLAERAKILCRGPSAEERGQRRRQLTRRVPVVGETPRRRRPSLLPAGVVR